MDRFDVMRAFVQVLECGSYTKAALQMNLHKATVSQQIRQLEDKLGTRLLKRTTRSVTPTEEGLKYYQHACTILQQVDDVESMMRQGTSAPAGHLRVDVPVALGRLVFAPEIRGFLERYPKITIEPGCNDRAVDLVQEGVDCALRGGQLPDSQLSASRVGDLRSAPHRTTSSTRAAECPRRPGSPSPDRVRARIDWQGAAGDLAARRPHGGVRHAGAIRHHRQRGRSECGPGQAGSHRAGRVRGQPLPEQRRPGAPLSLRFPLACPRGQPLTANRSAGCRCASSRW
jgi:LysR family transcriptional regulator for bpeEF and oprC